MREPQDTEIMLEIRLRRAQGDADSRRAYEELYSTQNIAQRASTYLWLVELFRLGLRDTYLDVSCGQGQMAALADAAGAEAHGLDLAHTALRQGKEAGVGAHLVAGNGQQLPYANDTFSVVSNIGSLEHYVDMPAAVREMARVLQPGGRAYVLLPNTFSLTYNIWIALRQGRTHVDEQPIQRYAARREWQQLLEDNGLSIMRVLKFERERPRTWADLYHHLRHPKALLRLLASPFVPLNLAHCFVFVCGKANR